VSASAYDTVQRIAFDEFADLLLRYIAGIGLAAAEVLSRR